MAAPYKQVVYQPPRPNAWLWQMAGVLILCTAGIIYVMRRQLPDPEVEQQIHRVMAGGSIAVGLCVICAMASRWVRR